MKKSKKSKGARCLSWTVSLSGSEFAYWSGYIFCPGSGHKSWYGSLSGFLSQSRSYSGKDSI